MNNKHIDIIKSLNNRIVELKKSGSRITQQMISDKTGINRTQLSRMLSGQITMSLENACAIAGILGIEIGIIGNSKDAYKPAGVIDVIENTDIDVAKEALDAYKAERRHVMFLESQINMMWKEIKDLKIRDIGKRNKMI
jgi:transcriptional regulator with XRE-family HTH domain